ncbi:MAG: hypothetical protein ABJN26_25790 [Stappiaceae bacterium]
MNRPLLTFLFLPIASLAVIASPAIANEAGADGQTVPWWTAPGETDSTAFSALILVFLLVLAVFHFYARFDRYAEKHNEGTPLQTTVPMLLMIAFAYEIFPPLSHFSSLLPIALIATALARDLMLWFEPMKEHTLKGELEGLMLEDLQRQHLGEHDRDGRRVQPPPGEKPPSGAEPIRPVQAVNAQPTKSAKTPSPAAPQKQTARPEGETDND